jgi:hypothetical protein
MFVFLAIALQRSDRYVRALDYCFTTAVFVMTVHGLLLIVIGCIRTYDVIVPLIIT